MDGIADERVPMTESAAHPPPRVGRLEHYAGSPGSVGWAGASSS